MSEDAVFKALLKNKPQQTTQPDQKKAEAPVKNVPRASAASSEDALYKALLKNKPQQSQVQKAPPVRTETPAPQVHTEPVIEAAAIPPTAAPAPAQEQIDQVAESIKNLTASVNLVYGLMKTAVIVMILILIVGLANLIRV
ncbi:MAG: hypothetical protein OIN66_00105 [Candidatus Methanoperedens sp.]|nr:hypothetical protein [Candidatus Methanoperedens sp.]